MLITILQFAAWALLAGVVMVWPVFMGIYFYYFILHPDDSLNDFWIYFKGFLAFTLK